MRDLERLHLASQRLMALGNALNSTGLQGKPALLELLSEVHADVDTIFRKGVVGLANHMRRGKAPRLNGAPAFGEHVMAVMEVELARLQAPPATGEGPGAAGAAPAGAPESSAPEMGAVGTQPTLAAALAPEPGAR